MFLEFVLCNLKTNKDYLYTDEYRKNATHSVKHTVKMKFIFD